MTNKLAFPLAIASGIAIGLFMPTGLADKPATPTPTITPTQVREFIAEDDPRWNCMTMGNKDCGPEWDLITDQGVVEDITPTEGARCLIRVADTSLIVCDDGTMTTS